jgi:hypothetical protein
LLGSKPVWIISACYIHNYIITSHSSYHPQKLMVKIHFKVNFSLINKSTHEHVNP